MLMLIEVGAAVAKGEVDFHQLTTDDSLISIISTPSCWIHNSIIIVIHHMMHDGNHKSENDDNRFKESSTLQDDDDHDDDV